MRGYSGIGSSRSPAPVARKVTLSRAFTVLAAPAILALALVAPTLMAQPADAAAPAGSVHSTTAPTPWQIQETPDPQVKDEMFNSVSCTSSSNCVAVGDRLNEKSDQVTLAELWNGTSWEMMSSPNPAGADQPELESVSCASAESCVAVGQAEAAGQGKGNVPEPLAESWNGSSWTIDSLPASPSPGFLSGVSCPTTSRCMAVGVRFDANGGFGGAAADSWNGSTWERTKVVQPSGNMGASLDSVSCSAAASCEAVGGFSGDGEEGVTLAEIWDGTTWMIQKTPNPKGSSYTLLDSVSCVSASDCVAVGLASPITLPGPISLAETWNGTSWSIMSTPNPAGTEGVQLFGVSCSSAKSCVAVGQNSVGNQINDTLAMTWNGKTWTIEATSTPSPQGGYLDGVARNSPSSCTAVGFLFGSTNPSVLLVESWDGETWSLQKAAGKTGLLGAGLSAVSCLSESFCLAVGTDEFRSDRRDLERHELDGHAGACRGSRN